MNRRLFLKNAATVAGATLAAQDLLRAQSAALPAAATAPVAAASPKATIGIATAIGPLVQRDIGEVLDDMQQHGAVNAVFPFIYTHGLERAGLPAAGFRGGNYAMPHMQYYKDINLTFEDMRAPELGSLDVFERLIPAAQKRGMKTFAWILEDNVRPTVANWEPMYEIDVHGRRGARHPSGPCNNHPQYRAYLMGLVEDYIRSYPIDGVMWGSERQGAVHNVLGAFHNGARTDPGLATCFCEFCLKKAKDRGIDADRARQGFGALEQFVRNGRAGQRPGDGYFVSFYRLLVKYPELLAWENLWVQSRHELQAQLYQKIKSLNPKMPVGWHLWHNISFSPFHRAEEDYADYVPFSDYLKPVLYSNCAGERMRSFTDSVHQNVFGDSPASETMAMLYQQLNYNEAAYDQVAAAGLSADYVGRETARALAGVAPAKVQVWPGLDIDVPTGAGSSKCTPESVKATVRAAFKAGAQGLILSRNYAEMTPASLAAAGEAIREMGMA